MSKWRHLLCAFTWHSWEVTAMLEPWFVRCRCSFCGVEKMRWIQP